MASFKDYFGKGSPKRVTVDYKGIDGTSAQGILVVDVTTMETVSMDSELTSHPVESGPNVTDHIKTSPVKIDIEGIISEHPLTFSQDYDSLTKDLKKTAMTQGRGFAGSVGSSLGSKFGAKQGALGKAVGGVVGANALSAADNPAQAARQVLEDVWANKLISSITTKYKTYENMVLTRLSFPRSNETGMALRFSASFQHINIIQPATVNIKSIARSAAAGAAPKTKLGQQTPQPANEDTTNKNKSWLKKIFN